MSQSARKPRSEYTCEKRKRGGRKKNTKKTPEVIGIEGGSGGVGGGGAGRDSEMSDARQPVTGGAAPESPGGEIAVAVG